MLETALAIASLNRHTDNKDRITTPAYAHQASIAVFTDVSMDTQSIPWCIEIDNGGFSFHVRKYASQQICNVRWKGWRRLGRVHFIGPVILTAKSYPPELSLQKAGYGQGIMEFRVLWLKAQPWIWAKSEKGCMLWAHLMVVEVPETFGGHLLRARSHFERRVLYIVMRMDIGFVLLIRQISMQ